MSSKSSKKTTITTSYSSSSSAGGSDEAGSSFSSSRLSGSGRPPSPARLSRMQEQEELQGLNDRLAAYIDRVRSLELENNRLTLQVRSTEEVVKREVSSVKTLYESELAELRKLLDETAKDKARLQIDANKYKADYEDLLAKYNKRDRDASGFERRVQLLERQLAENNTRELEKENQNLKNELAKLEKQLATAKKQLEDETLNRVDLENRVKTLKEDIHFKSTLYEQELEESRTRVTTQLEDVDDRVEREYEARLQDALKEIRAQHDFDLQSVKVELETLYETKINDLRGQAERGNSSSTAAWEELMTVRQQFDDMQAELNKLKSEKAGWDLRVRDLEKQIASEREEFRRRIAQRDEELRLLRSQMDSLEMEYAALLEIKIKLDRELEAYNKLLQSEESRLNISASATSERSTPSTSGAKKRRRMDIGQAVEEYTQRSATGGFKRSGSSTCGVEISEVDSEGKFVKLTNTTAKDVHLHQWQLCHVAGDNETKHKFGKNVLKAGQSVTIWSSDSDTTHNPPHDLVMKGKRWFVSEEMTTSLINSDSEEVATCTMTKSIRTVTSFTQRRGGLRESEIQDKDKCFVM